MKKSVIILISASLLLFAGIASGFVPASSLIKGWKVFKPKKGIVIGLNQQATGSYCCTFADGTKCYSSDCSFCGCSGVKLSELKQKKNAIQVQVGRKGNVNVKAPSTTSDNNSSSYCCTFSDGTKCYSSDCSFCGCN